MPNTELIDYIREQTQQGVSADALRQELMETGWHEQDIENALRDVAAGLHPVTAGASIHEDLAQVRGMVAHLATRVRTLEATLASTQTLAPVPVSMPLSGGTLAINRTLAPAHRSLKHSASILIIIALCATAGYIAASLVPRAQTAPVVELSIVAAIACIGMVVAVALMRRGHGFASRVLTASVCTVWAVETLIAWRFYRLTEWYTALLLGVFIVVLAIVAVKWSDRLARE